MSTARSLVAAAIVVLLTGCGGGPSSTDSGAADRSPGSAGPDDQDAPLEGVWHTEPLTVEQTTSTLRRHGLGRWVADYRRNAPFSGDTVLTLTIEDGAWDLYGQVGDGPAPEVFQRALYMTQPFTRQD